MAHDDETDWTAEEREALDRLPREIDPGRPLEDRTVAALRQRGLLGRPASLPGRRTRSGPRAVAGSRHGSGSRFSPAWLVAGVAASLALFFAGLAVGQARSSAAAYDLVLALRTAEAAERPSLVQETGSLYVDALASLAVLRAQGDEAALGTGVEVGIATLYAATWEMARLHPEDPRLREVLRALDPTTDTERSGGADPELTWF